MYKETTCRIAMFWYSYWNFFQHFSKKTALDTLDSFLCDKVHFLTPTQICLGPQLMQIYCIN